MSLCPRSPFLGGVVRRIDAAFILDTLICEAGWDKKQLFVAFIDFKKAYDFVFRDGLFFKMLCSGVWGRVFEVLRSMYSSVKAVVKENGSVMTEDVIEQMVGLRQAFYPRVFSLSLLRTFLVTWKGRAGRDYGS